MLKEEINSTAEIIIYDMLGNKVYEQQVNPGLKDFMINTENLPTGFYIVKIDNQNSFFVKE